MYAKPGRSTVRRIPVAAGAAALLVALVSGTPPLPVAHAAFPGGNGTIVFRSGNTIATMNADGTGYTEIATSINPRFRFSNPTWSSDGKRIAFDDSSDHIYVMDASGANLHVAATVPGAHDPAWSPDGARIAYAVVSPLFYLRDERIEIIDLANPTPTVLIGSASVVEIKDGPSWSPDGTRIAVSAVEFAPSFGPFNAGIAVVDVHGGNVNWVTPSGTSQSDEWPDWSPDGSSIAFSRSGSIYRVHANGSGLTNLRGGGTRPAWSPDGTRIAVRTSISGYDIWTLDAIAGSGLMQLTRSDGADMPSWQPVPPSVSISGAATVTEGNAGATKATLDVHLSAPSGGTVTVQYHTIDGTAQGTPALRADYVSKTDSVTFLPGELSKSIDVDVLGDTLDEADETFTVELSSASGAALDPAASTGEVTIIDDDPLPTITIHDASVTEGNTALVEVTLSSASGRPVTVGWSTADGTAHQPDDYAGAGTITFDPNLGQTSQTIQVATVADTLDEFDETFVVSLSAPTNATIAGASATVTIIDDDTAAVSIDDVFAAEGNFGTTPFAFTVSLSTATDHPITVDYTTVDGTATFATDYYRTYGSLTFLATDPLKRTLTVQVAGDTTVEPDETFTVVLSNASSAVGRSPGLGTIRNDDAPTGTPVETVSLPTVAGGTVTTDTEGDGATASDPVETWVMTPNAGTVSITEAPAVLTPTAFSFLGWDVTITAPRATAANPLVLVFRLDATLVPSNPTSFQVFRNGVQVPDCTGAGAVPDPCVAGRNLLPGGDLELTVRTSAASRWTFARAIVSSGEVDGEELRSSSGGEASLEAEAHRGRIGGRLRFHDRTTRFRSREITALAIAADGQSAWLAGQGEDGRTFVAFVAESRGHRSDRFQLWIAGVKATGDGRLDRGEIDIERGEGREQQDGARDEPSHRQ